MRQQQHWASLCVCESSCARGPGVPSFLPTDTQKHCCHSSHLWINEVLSSQVCSGTGKCGAKACSVAQLQVSELLLNSRPVPWLAGWGGGGHRLVTWTHWSHINHSVYCWKFSNLQAAVRALGSSGALPLALMGANEHKYFWEWRSCSGCSHCPIHFIGILPLNIWFCCESRLSCWKTYALCLGRSPSPVVDSAQHWFGTAAVQTLVKKKIFFLCSELALKGLGGVHHGLFRSTVTFFRLSGKNFSKLVC